MAPAQAGTYTDALGQCLVAKASTQDRTELMRWVFAALALHPDIKSLATIDDATRAQLDATTGKLFERLLTSDCRAELVVALRNEGPASVQGSFKTLGEIASGGLFASPEVAAGMSGMASHVDQQALQAVFEEAGAPAQ